MPFDAAVSPDCRRVAWIGDRGTGSGQEDLFVADADGSHRLRLTSDPTDEWFPAWSADGKRIVFVDRPTIQVIGADGTGRLTVSRCGGSCAGTGWPIWSPDGTQIAFANARVGGWHIWIMNADG
ncbi:MAG TPA: Tol-Pal system protein TolB, partial [Actinobacteria bacterium]|nr:Tol-Pal system protein TolB [Actinomycetota bacterium]